MLGLLKKEDPKIISSGAIVSSGSLVSVKPNIELLTPFVSNASFVNSFNPKSATLLSSSAISKSESPCAFAIIFI